VAGKRRICRANGSSGESASRLSAVRGLAWDDRSCQVALAKSLLPSRSCQIALAKSLLPNRSCQVAPAKSLLPSRSCQVALAKSTRSSSLSRWRRRWQIVRQTAIGRATPRPSPLTDCTPSGAFSPATPKTAMQEAQKHGSHTHRQRRVIHRRSIASTSREW
jgi:hypothetical protein